MKFDAKFCLNHDRRTEMRLNVLYLTGALTILAVPLSAGAQPAEPTDPAQLNRQATTGFQEANPAEDACGPRWRWEEAGYAKHGAWRPAHCAPREMAY
jgi:hypothetical protein